MQHRRPRYVEKYMIKRYRNLAPTKKPSFRDFWHLARTPRKAWKYIENVKQYPPPPERVNGSDLRVTMVNHMTLLIQTMGLNILTDPIWSKRCSPVQWAGPKRYRPPGVKFTDLPPIDIILLSHDHYDHMDKTSLIRLHKAFQPTIITGKGNTKHLSKWKINTGIELDWWEKHNWSSDIHFTATPAQHFSGRTLWDRNKTLWIGLWIHTPHGDIYFAGDTGMGPHFEKIRTRLGVPRLSLIPIGAFQPRWFMSPVHLDPEEAWTTHKILHSQNSVATHYGTFALAMDEQNEPEEKIKILRHQEPQVKFWVLDYGEGRDIVLEESPISK